MQASRFEFLSFDPFALFQNGFVASEVDVGGRDVFEALVVALMVVVIDEGFDLGFKITGQEVVFQQDAVLQGLMPSLHAPAVHCAAMSRKGTTWIIEFSYWTPKCVQYRHIRSCKKCGTFLIIERSGYLTLQSLKWVDGMRLVSTSSLCMRLNRQRSRPANFLLPERAKRFPKRMRHIPTTCCFRRHRESRCYQRCARCYRPKK